MNTWLIEIPLNIHYLGNKYYINHDYPVPRNRWVVFSEKTFEHTWDFDASDVPAEWHRWLHYMTDDPPTADGVMPVERVGCQHNWNQFILKSLLIVITILNMR